MGPVPAEVLDQFVRDGSLTAAEVEFTGFDDKIIALDARGLTVGEIQAFLAEM